MDYADKITNLDNIDIDNIADTSSDNIQVDSIQSVNKKYIANHTTKYIFTDPFVSIYPEDNILVFKKKIYATIGIPIFRQHIWYTYNGRVYPLNYSIYSNSSLIFVNMATLLTKYNDPKYDITNIDKIPVNQKYYQIKNTLKVKTNDTFSIMDEFYHKYGVTEFNMMDLDDFVKNSDNQLKK